MDTGLHFRRTLLAAGLVLAAVLCAGCSPSPARKLVGTWVVDDQALGGMVAVADARLELTADGKLMVSSKLPVVGTRVTKSGTWKFISAAENVLTLQVNIDGMDRPQQVAVTLLEDDSIQLKLPVLPGDVALKFERARNL